MNIAIVGAGTVGTAVAVRWTRAGHAIVAVTGPDGVALLIVIDDGRLEAFKDGHVRAFPREVAVG